MKHKFMYNGLVFTLKEKTAMGGGVACNKCAFTSGTDLCLESPKCLGGHYFKIKSVKEVKDE